jgi:protein-glutamine gamma-glutamyltransferase
VVLMRALDVPARIVTGYQGGEQNAMDGYWVVRQSDAHAWAEIWQAGVGWVRVDPTGAVAPNRVGALTRLVAQPGLMAAALGTMSPNLAAKLRDAWDAVNNGWNQWVLNYGKTSQLNLLKNLGFQTPGWEDLGYLLSGLLVLASSLGAAWTLWERRQHDPWLRLFAQATTRALATGISLPAHCPPRDMASRLSAQFGDAAAAPSAWLLQLERLRYARGAIAVQSKTSPTLAHLKRELKTLDWPRATP